MTKDSYKVGLMSFKMGKNKNRCLSIGGVVFFDFGAKMDDYYEVSFDCVLDMDGKSYFIKDFYTYRSKAQYKKVLEYITEDEFEESLRNELIIKLKLD